MRLLVTGADGFIGTHLTRELDNAGHDVHGIDRVHGDLTKPGEFAHWLDITQPDRVVHLAAQVGRLFGEADLKYTIESNALMSAFVARACGERQIPVLYSSTSEIYGDHGARTCYEDAGPFSLPHNLYGLSKKWAEDVFRLYAPDGLRIVRLSMPYGPGAPPGKGRRAMDNFLWNAHHRKSITVHRGSERSWCHVSDTVRGIRLVLENGAYRSYNVGRDDKPLSMLDLAWQCCDMAGAPNSLIHEVDPPAMQTVVKKLSTERLRSLDWKPQIELSEGLPELYDWVRQFDADGNYMERLAA